MTSSVFVSTPPKSNRAAAAVLFTLLAVALVWAFRDGLAAAVRLWDVSPMYSYGYTVPFVSAYLLWTRREALSRLEPRPMHALGGCIVALALLMLLAGRVSGIQVLEQVAFIVSIVGATVFVFGRRYLRVSAAAVLYLLLMIPIWDGFTESLHWPFQQRSAEMGVAMLHALGIPAYREGTIIALPNVTLEVARSCSGVNYLVAVLALGLPLSYLYLRGWWRRIALLVFAMAVAALSNGLRVALIGTLAYLDVGSPLHGPGHVLHGLFVAGVGYGALFLGLRLLAATSPATTPPLSAGAPRLPIAFRYREPLVLVAVFVVFGAALGAYDPRPVPLKASLDDLPYMLGSWQSSPTSVGAHRLAERWGGAEDRSVRRRYRSADGELADVYVGYFEFQRQSKELVNFRGADLHRQAVPREIRGSGVSLPANYLADAGDGVAAMFWYEIDGAVEVSAVRAKLRTMWNAVVRQRTNGAVIIVASAGSMSSGATVSQLEDLSSRVHGALGQLLPNGK